jgi:hypothetical protein
MHLCECLVAIGGDIQQKMFKRDITPAEIDLLRRIHGMEAITEIRITGSEPRQQEDELARLRETYPKFAALAQDLWRDRGGRLATDIRDLNLDKTMLAQERKTVFELVDEYDAPPDQEPEPERFPPQQLEEDKENPEIRPTKKVKVGKTKPAPDQEESPPVNYTVGRDGRLRFRE